MAKEICISTTPHETRLAIIEDDLLTEIYYERENEYTLAGSIYKGKVTRVLPGMQSAFVDLGLERDAFLYVTDFLEEQEDSEDFAEVPQGEGRKERSETGRNGGRRGSGERGSDRGSNRTQDRSERPAAAQGSEPASSAAAEAEGEPAESGKGQDEFQQGTRRWRGRRGRRRGVRSPQGQNVGQAAGGGETTAEQGEFEGSGLVSIEAEAETSAEGSIAESFGEEGRRGGRRERGRPQGGPATITLPGEALQKYGQQPVSSELQITPLAAEPEDRRPQVTVRPSTLVEQPIVWDGVSVALPGETLSRHRERPTPDVEHTIPELHAAKSENAAIDTAFPPAHAEEPAPLILEEEEIEEGDAPSTQVPEEQEETEFDAENASASHRVDPSSPSEFRLSSLFGRESEPVEKHEQPVPAGEAAESKGSYSEQIDAAVSEVPVAEQPAEAQNVAPAWSATGTEAPAEPSHEAAALDHLHAFTPGDGQVEEEVIDEEEYDFAPLPEHAIGHDDDEGDLVEEETRVAGGAEIGDSIRDAQIDRQVISSDDDDFEDSDEEEEGAEGEQPAAVSTEEGVPAPRRGRSDRQRGRDRERRGRGRNGRRQSAQTSDLPIISELLKQG